MQTQTAKDREKDRKEACECQNQADDSASEGGDMLACIAKNGIAPRQCTQKVRKVGDVGRLLPNAKKVDCWMHSLIRRHLWNCLKEERCT